MIVRTRTRTVSSNRPAALPAPVQPVQPPVPTTRHRIVPARVEAVSDPVTAALQARFTAGAWVIASEAKAHRVRPAAGYAQYCQFFVLERRGSVPVPLAVWEVSHRHRTCGITGYDATLVAPDAETAVEMFHAVNPNYQATGVRRVETTRPALLRI